MMLVKNLLKISFISLVCLTACKTDHIKLQNGAAPVEVVKEVPVPDDVTPPKQDTDLKLCSKLDLKEVVWPAELSVAEWTYYALGLNITGSFEGRQGWKNITGNFDGQGMSLGLMQQNFGQGSLQPWLIEMYRQHNSTLLTHFNNQDYKKMQLMLEDWLNDSINLSSLTVSEELFPQNSPVNKLDVGFEESLKMQSSSENSKSVQWAKSNLLDSKGNVTSRWKESFQGMAESTGYRSFQLAASTKIFNKAKNYFNYFQFRELRFLLFLFDIVVQNGSIQDGHLSLYNKWVKNNPNATEQARALALLEARLTTVKPQYVQDVRSRKSTIIHGTGTVHQTVRNLPAEYCFDPRVIVQ